MAQTAEHFKTLVAHFARRPHTGQLIDQCIEVGIGLRKAAGAVIGHRKIQDIAEHAEVIALSLDMTHERHIDFADDVAEIGFIADRRRVFAQIGRNGCRPHIRCQSPIPALIGGSIGQRSASQNDGGGKFILKFHVESLSVFSMENRAQYTH